jgi:hypothetical protein
MKYLKYLRTLESWRHWTEALYGKVEFDRLDDIKELTYIFADELDMVSDIGFFFKKNGFSDASSIKWINSILAIINK